MSKTATITVVSFLALTAVLVLLVTFILRSVIPEFGGSDEFKQTNLKDWTYVTVSSGEDIPPEYLDHEELYLFASKEAIRGNYDFEKCTLDGEPFVKVNSDFNVPTAPRGVVFLVARTSDAPKGTQLLCPDLPDDATAAVGYLQQ